MGGKYEIEEGARTILRAEEVRADKKLFPKVQKELERQAAAAQRAALEGRIRAKMKKAFPKD
jgi:hypothetical protein